MRSIKNIKIRIFAVAYPASYKMGPKRAGAEEEPKLYHKVEG